VAIGFTYQPTPVPAQLGRTNYVDNDLIGITAGAKFDVEFQNKTSLTLGIDVQFWQMFTRTTWKDPRQIIDEFPDDSKTALTGVSGFALSKDGGKVLYRSQETYGITEVAEGKKTGDGKLATDALMTTVDPRREWLQVYDEAWRLEGWPAFQLAPLSDKAPAVTCKGNKVVVGQRALWFDGRKIVMGEE
jgi:hypothetical protein